MFERLGDAALMFWQSLDDRERRMIVMGVVYGVYLVAASVAASKHREHERRQLAIAIAEELRNG